MFSLITSLPCTFFFIKSLPQKGVATKSRLQKHAGGRPISENFDSHYMRVGGRGKYVLPSPSDTQVLTQQYVEDI